MNLIKRIDNFVSKYRIQKDFNEDRLKALRIIENWKKETPSIYRHKTSIDPKNPFNVRTVKVKRK